MQNFLFRWLQALKRHEKSVTTTYTVHTGRSTDGFAIDNPVNVDGSGGAYTITVPDGYVIGQTLVISCQTAGNNVTISFTHHANGDAGTATLDAADEALVSMWSGTEWFTIKAQGCSDVS